MPAPEKTNENMDTFKPISQPQKSPIRWLSLLQLVLSALAVIFLLGAAIIIFSTAIVQRYTQGASSANLTQLSMISASLAFTGILALPSAWFAWKRLANPHIEFSHKPEPRYYGLVLTILVVVVVAGAIFLGNWASRNPQVSWFLLPPLNIIATGLPALWLVYIGTRGLPQASPSRKWGVFVTGLILGPLLILILELFTLFGVGLIALLWILVDPSLSAQLNNLVLHLQVTGPDPQAIQTFLLPLLLNPLVLFLVFTFISVLVPLIEEAVKPIGVWFLAEQKITPMQGFALGILSGIGFGLFENLGNSSSGGDSWALLVTTRISTLLLHGLTAGLVGWAIASAWSQKRYMRLAITYLFAVLLHGLWNGMAVLTLFSGLKGQVNTSIPTILVELGNLSAIGIAAIGAFNLVFYIGFNAALRRNLRPSTLVPGVEPEAKPAELQPGTENPVSTPGELPPTPDTGVNALPGKTPPDDLE